MKKLLLICLLLTSCSTWHTQVENFPKLKVQVYEVEGFVNLQSSCGYSQWPLWKKMIGTFVVGCSFWDIQKETCDVYIPKDGPDWILEHELKHCDGYDHDDTMEQTVKKYRNSLK